MPFNGMYQWMAKGSTVLFFSKVFGMVVAAFVFLIFRARKDSPITPGVVCLELAFSKERFNDIVTQWRKSGVLQKVKIGIGLDLFFAVAYAFFFSSLLAWSTIKPDKDPGPVLILFFILPLVAGALDLVENFAHLYLLRDIDNLSEPLIVLSARASLLKWWLFVVAFSTSVSLGAIHVIEEIITSPETAYQGMAEWQIALVVALVLTVAFFIFLMTRDKSSVKAPSIFCLQFAFTEKRFKKCIEQWLKHDGLVLKVRKRGLKLDLPFPFVYVPFLAIFFARSTITPGEDPGSILIFLFTLPFVAGALDWVENGLHLLWVLHDPNNCPEPLIFLASTAATIKYLFIAVSLLVSICHLLCK